MQKSPFDCFPHIETAELTLRKIVSADTDALFEIYGNERLFRYSPSLLKKNRDTVANMIGHFERDFLKRKWLHLGIVPRSDPGLLAGVFELFDYQSDVDAITIGYRLNEQFWGRGLATKAVAAVVDYLFHETCVNRVEAFVMPENTRSLEVLRRNRFVEEGIIRQGYRWKDKGIVDLVLFSLLRNEYPMRTS
jgi:ribosomal-protein-alanine N-acetyltransferase